MVVRFETINLTLNWNCDVFIALVALYYVMLKPNWISVTIHLTVVKFWFEFNFPVLCCYAVMQNTMLVLIFPPKWYNIHTNVIYLISLLLLHCWYLMVKPILNTKVVDQFYIGWLHLFAFPTMVFLCFAWKHHVRWCIALLDWISWFVDFMVYMQMIDSDIRKIVVFNTSAEVGKLQPTTGFPAAHKII